MADFFAMGGNGVFVWSTVGLSILTLGFNIVSARRHLRQALARLRLERQHAAPGRLGS